jgi:hypothetical protein
VTLQRRSTARRAAAVTAGQWLLVVVGPAACDSGCEQRLYAQRQLREMLGRERDRLDKLWLVTDDGAQARAARRGAGEPPE